MHIHRTGPETPRLLHRAFEPADAEVLFALNSDPEVMRYTGEPLWESVEQTRARITAYPDFERYGFGRWACILKSEQRIVGMSGLKYLEDLGEVDVGYRFFPAYWGRGLATEAAAAALGFGFDVLGLERIIGLVLPDNRASVHVLEKIGMHLDGRARCGGESALRYVVHRDDLRPDTP